MEYANDAAAQAAYVTNGGVSANIKVLVVGGGGGGGGYSGGGGGGGSVEYNASFAVTAKEYAVTVGEGGTFNISGGADGTNGNNSVFDSITAYGGGLGALGGGDNTRAAVSGGSGGGGGSSSNTAGAAAGSGSNVFAGGNSSGASGNYVSGGGGGAGAVGQNTANDTTVANGGIGVPSNIYDGSNIYYGGGGGGGSYNHPSYGGAGGAGGGGHGGEGTAGTGGTNGTANTGGGGGGGGSTSTGFTGGSGIVIIRYTTTDFIATGGDITVDGSETVHTFLSSGTFTIIAPLQSYSESTIKEQGSYSLKGIGAITTSLNKTLTRTIGSPIDLSAQDMVSFKMRSSRTGANIKIGIHDVGGTTTEVTPTIAVADTWQTINMSLYAVASANKDAIDSIIITIVNADASNTFYIDDMLGENIAIVTTAYSVELRNKSFQFKQYLTPFVNKIQWEWNRLGGCGRCQIEITKGYRDIIFSARDDIQIRVKDGSTTKLVYRGYLANITPMLKVGQTITLDVRGYFDILKKIVVHNAGDTLSYAAKTVAFMADDIADTFIVPNTPITIAGALTAGAFEADAMDFLCTVDEALRTLAELQGDIEYGVNENLVLFWETESTTINNKFFVGNNVAVLERKVNWDSLVNKIYLIGGEVAGVKYKKTAENTDSQAEYYLVEEILNNSSITTNSVSAQYMSSILSERAQPKFSFKAQIKNTALRIEDTVPLGQVTFYDASYDNVSLGDLIGSIIGETADGGSDITIGETGDGGSDVTVGRSFSDQIDRISYKLSDTPGRFNIEVQLGDTTLETAAKIKQLELKLNSLQATG